MTAAEIDQYVTMVENRVKGLWVIPDQLSARGLKAVIGFYINKNGEVMNLSIKQSSGNTPYDQSVILQNVVAVPAGVTTTPPTSFRNKLILGMVLFAEGGGLWKKPM